MKLEYFRKPIATLFVLGFMFLFWEHFDNKMEYLNSRAVLTVQNEIISLKQEKEIIKMLEDYVEELLNKYGILLRIHIAETPIPVPELENRSIFIGYEPQKDAVLYQLGTKDFGNNFVQVQEELRSCTDSPVQCLEKALQQIMGRNTP